MNNISNSNNTYSQNTLLRNSMIGLAGTAVAWEAEPLISKALYYPTRKYIGKNFANINENFMPYIQKAIKNNNLNDTFKMINLNPKTIHTVAKDLDFPKMNIGKKILFHILRLPNPEKILKATSQGCNAFFMPIKNAIVFNFDKFSAPAFHEIAHKLNSTSSNIVVKTLSHIRGPLARFFPLYISLTALTTDKKDKNEPNQGFKDFIKRNCGILTFASILPLTIEEFIANFKGTKIAQNAGVQGELLKKIKCCHKLSVLSYATAAIAAGLSVHLANKLRNEICSYKKQ